MDELIDIFDENDISLGIQKMKSEAHRAGLWHRAAHVWLYNGRGELLLQLRSKDKEILPDTWDVSAAGHVGAGETPLAAALRETAEELGLPLEAAQLDFFKIGRADGPAGRLINREHQYVYLCRFDGRAEELTLQAEEVQAARFFTREELEWELDAEPEKHAPHRACWLEIMAEARRRV